MKYEKRITKMQNAVFIYTLKTKSVVSKGVRIPGPGPGPDSVMECSSAFIFMI